MGTVRSEKDAELRRLCVEIERLALGRLDAPFTYEQAALYRRLCQREKELLADG